MRTVIPGPVALIDVASEGDGVRLEARLTAVSRVPVEWRLTVDTNGRGGRGRVTKSGFAERAGSGVLASVRLNNPGRAELEIFSHGVLVGHVGGTFHLPSQPGAR